MRKGILLLCLAFVMFGVVSFVNAATVSILWENTVDSAINDEVIVSAPGIYDISLLVSGVELTPPIFELQFDLIAPMSWQFSPTPPLYGDAVAPWVMKMGGLSAPNTYTEFSAEFMGGAIPLQNGFLLSGLQLTIPNIPPQMNEILTFGNAQGDYAPFLDFADLKITSVPIPGAIWLLGSGLVGLIGFRKRFSKT